MRSLISALSTMAFLHQALSFATTMSSTRSKLYASMSTATTGKTVLVLGGTGFLGQNICKQALEQGYNVVSLSRRGRPTEGPVVGNVDYRQGDARKASVVTSILEENEKVNFAGIVHCIGLLFDEQSGLGSYNRFVSGSGSLPDAESTYETITRQTAFNAIQAATTYAQNNKITNFPFCFTSAAEAGWPEMGGGDFIENNLAPDFLKRYLAAKRAVEQKLLASSPPLRPIIMRPSLIYSMDRPLSFPSVGAFIVGNAIGLPFVDRPVLVQDLSKAMVLSLSDSSSVRGVQRYPEIDRITSSSDYRN